MDKLIKIIENQILNDFLAQLPGVEGFNVKKFFEICNANGVRTKTMMKIMTDCMEAGVLNGN